MPYLRLVPILALCLLLGACSATRTGGPAAPPEAPPSDRPADAPRTVQGFRIQLYTTDDKPAADAHVAETLDWWASVPQHRRPGELRSGRLPVYVAYHQPYYRVRVGDFTSRAAARRALDLFASQFPNAMIVPDTVTL